MARQREVFDMCSQLDSICEQTLNAMNEQLGLNPTTKEILRWFDTYEVQEQLSYCDNHCEIKDCKEHQYYLIMEGIDYGL